MANGCNSVQGIHSCGCNRNVNNAAVIIAAIIALILINILDDETNNCIGQALQSIGELMQLGGMENCLTNCFNNCCSYY